MIKANFLKAKLLTYNVYKIYIFLLTISSFWRSSKWRAHVCDFTTKTNFLPIDYSLFLIHSLFLHLSDKKYVLYYVLIVSPLYINIFFTDNISIQIHIDGCYFFDPIATVFYWFLKNYSSRKHCKKICVAYLTIYIWTRYILIIHVSRR